MVDLPLRKLPCATRLVVVLLCFAFRPIAASAADPAAEPKANTGGETAGKAAGSADQATPQANQMPADVEALTSACKQAASGLDSGDVSLKALPDTKRTTVIQHQTAARLFTCLAIADDKNARCDALPKQAKSECMAQFDIARELKGLPKERVKAQIIYRSCLPNAAKADCETARQAIAAGDPAKCKGLSKGVNPDFCAALATGDAAKCGALSGGEREFCTAYVTDDPNRCPKDSADCKLVVSTFAKLKKEGLEGFQDIDPTLAAASKGKAACAPLVSEFEKFCATVQ